LLLPECFAASPKVNAGNGWLPVSCCSSIAFPRTDRRMAIDHAPVSAPDAASRGKAHTIARSLRGSVVVSKNQSKHRTALRQRRLDPIDEGESTRFDPRPWWAERHPWPPGVHFEDAATGECAGGAMPSLPVREGMFGTAAGLCADAGESGG
jgi:hypothetical protein